MGRMTHLLTDTVTVASESGVNGYGDPTFGAQSTIACRVEEVDTIVIGTDHNEYRAVARIATEDEVFLTDRFWLPGDSTGDDDAARRPLTVKHSRFPGETEGLYIVLL
jgi:hypothetical protein